MSLFRRRAEYDTQTVRGKLAALDREFVGAQQRLEDAALASALDDTDTRGDAAAATLAALRQRREVLVAALISAEQAEAAEAARKLAAARAAQNRAIRQQVSQLIRHATAYQTAIGDATIAWRRMVDTGDKIRKLIPPGPRGEWFALAVMPRRLTSRCLGEMARVGAAEPLTHDVDLPGSSWHGHELALGMQHVRELPPLGERLERELLGFYRQMTGETSPAPPPISTPVQDATPAPQEAATETQAVSVPHDGAEQVAVAHTAPVAAPAGLTSSPVTQMRPVPNPHSTGSPEAAQFDAALAEIARRRPAPAEAANG